MTDIFRFEGSNIVALPAKSSSFSFTSFAKSNKWGKDLCEDLVSPHFGQGFFWETWRRLPPLPSYCTPTYPYDAINVNYIAFPGTNVRFHYTQDHSKWGVSTSSSKPLVCVGGINRMESQRKRGGGTCCISHPPLWKALSALIDETEPCK